MNGKNLKHEIFSAVSLCGYPPNVIDSLIELISQIMNYPYVKSTPQYKIKTINQEKIIAVRCPMEIPFNKKVYEIPIVIFFSKFIPLEPPRILIEVSKGSAINPKAKNVDINTRKISTPSLLSWNQSSNIIVILNEIKASFSNVFPIYKVKRNSVECDSRPTLNKNNNQNHTNINNYAIFNLVNNNNNNNNNTKTLPNNDPFANIASLFTDNFMNNKNNNTGIYSNNGIQNINNNNNIMKIKMQNNPNNPNININDINNINNINYMNLKMLNNQNINLNKNNTNSNNNMNNMNNILNINQLYAKDNIMIKNILIESVFDKISSKLISEYKKLNQQNKTLNNYKNQFKNENDKIEKYISKKQDISNECTKILYYMNNEIKKTNEYIKKRKDKKITDQNCLEFVKVENPQVLRAIANEINYEELIIMIKKGFEKKKITFQEAISSTRDAARELFISKYTREKGLKNLSKFY